MSDRRHFLQPPDGIGKAPEYTKPTNDEELLDLCIKEVDEFLRRMIPGRTIIVHRPDYGDGCRPPFKPLFTVTIRPWPDVPDYDKRHRPRRGDDVEVWLTRMRDRLGSQGEQQLRALTALLDRYRECSDYGLTLAPEDDQLGDP
jgi:hypothetical protein